MQMFSYLWGTGTKKEEENSDPELAMREALDQHGEFKLNLDGTMDFEHFLIFRAIVMRQGCRKFQPLREELNVRKMEAFKEKDQATYVSVFREGQGKFNESIMDITKKACEWIEMDQSNYLLTVKTYMEDSQKRDLVQNKDAEVRVTLEGKEITEDKEVFKKAFMFKFQRDMDMHRKLQALRMTTSPEAQQEIASIENSKTSDALTIEFGFDLTHLMKGVKELKLGEDEEIVSFQKIVLAQKQSEEQAEIEKAKPSAELMQEMIGEAVFLGEPQYKKDGTMTFDFFLETSKLITKYVIKHTQSGLEDFAKQRRECIKNGDEDKFNDLILRTANWETLSHQIVQAHLYQTLKVPKTVFEKSVQLYLMEPSKRATYEEELQLIRDKLRTREPRELTRDEVLESVRLLEQAKFEAQKKMYDFVRGNKVPPQMINAVIQVEKLKADDRFFNKTGIEEEDVEPSIKRLNMEEDEDYKKIVEDYKQQCETFLQEKKDETAEILKQAAIMRLAQENAKKVALAKAKEQKEGAKNEEGEKVTADEARVAAEEDLKAAAA